MSVATPPLHAAARSTVLGSGPVRHALLALLLMVAAALLAWRLTPTVPLTSLHGEINLEQMVPRQFADWRVENTVAGAIVNPQQEALLKKLYSQTLSRSYINSQGARIMLSIAYGRDQRDGMQLHHPEVCYPAQGFQLKSNKPALLQLGGSGVPGRQLETYLGRQRQEPVTYWTVIGETAVRGGINKKLAEMRYGLRGLIPDGLLFRVSSINPDSTAAFALQQQFSAALLAAVPPGVRVRLVGQDLPL